MATMSLKSSQQLNYFDSLMAEYHTSITELENNMLSALSLSSAKYSSTKITATLDTGESVEVLGKFSSSAITISKISITNPNLNTKISLTMNWTITESGDYGLSSAYFKGYSCDFINNNGKKITVNESFDKLMMDGSTLALTNYKFTITDGYGGSVSLIVESLPMNTYINFTETTSFSNMIDLVGADTSIFNGNDTFDASMSSLNQSIHGYVGNDKLTAGSGDDTLDGGTGADAMKGGAGHDTYYIDNLSDKVTEAANQGNDTVHTTISLTKAINNVENFIADEVTNGDNNINLVGTASANTLTGNSGNNILDGGKGIDTMIGSAGNDTYKIDVAGETITELSNEGTDTVIAAVNYTLSTNVENLTLAGKALIGTGNDLDNIIIGVAGNNTLDGGAGNDTLSGGLGNDTLTGGTGYDVFVFDTKLNAKSNLDTITDFEANSDMILLKSAIFTKLTGDNNLSDNFYIVGSDTAQDANDYIVYNTTTGVLSYDADGSGKSAAINFAVLHNGDSIAILGVNNITVDTLVEP